MKLTRFKNGAVRDADNNKYDIDEYNWAFAEQRFFEHMMKNAKKYGAGNFKKGISEESYRKSLARHLWKDKIWTEHGLVYCENCRLISQPKDSVYFSLKYKCPHCNEVILYEDHLSAGLFNLRGIIGEQQIKKLNIKRNVDNRKRPHEAIPQNGKTTKPRKSKGQTIEKPWLRKSQ